MLGGAGPRGGSGHRQRELSLFSVTLALGKSSSPAGAIAGGWGMRTLGSSWLPGWPSPP